jgi:hypothetical protein
MEWKRMSAGAGEALAAGVIHGWRPLHRVAIRRDAGCVSTQSTWRYGHHEPIRIAFPKPRKLDANIVVT